MEERIEVLKGQISIEEVKIEPVAAIQELEDKYALKEDYDAIYHFERISEQKKIIKENEDIKKRRIKELEEKIKEVEEWFEGICKEPERLIELSKYRIEKYVKEKTEENPKYKLNVPGGKAVYKKRLKYGWAHDLTQMMQYLKENNPALIRTKVIEEPMKDKIKKAYPNGINPETGELIPGAEIEWIEEVKVDIE